MKNNVNKFITAIMIGVLLTQSIITPVAIYADETTPTPPAENSSSTESTTTQSTPSPEPQQTQGTTTTVSSPESTPAAPTPTLTRDEQREIERAARRAAMDAADIEEGDANRTESTTSAAVQGVQLAPTPTVSPSHTGGQTGSNNIVTGDATNGATIATVGNNNGAQTGCCTGGSGATVANSGNGTDSTNNGSATVANNNTTDQNNSAVVNNNLAGATVTGQNDSSNNVGHASITTGDSNTSGTLITAVNTNAAGIMVSEFNVVDDHTGDIVLDFGANCIMGCGTPATAINSGNGSNSDNSSTVDLTNSNNTFQNNDAQVGNDMILSADSGNNTTSANTGGNSSITTGDANVVANALTFANNNFAGNVIFGTVNIYGDLIGDIILTEEELARYGVSTTGTNASNIGNGTGSDNTSSIDLANTNNTFQNNDATILNNILYDAQTGNNDVSGNTGGDSSITTGDTDLLANVLNIANTNVAGGNMWLVLVNRAGQWFGQLLGAPEGSQYAGSAGFEFLIGENGEITASNAGNGSGSTNDSAVSQTNNNTTEQNNTAIIENNLDLRANTGGNEASNNTGGNSSIKTGDAQIIANIVNFVNNNVTGNGKLFVTVVNVFGNWLGDFVAPGQQKRADSPANTAQNSGNNESSKTSTTKTVAGTSVEKTVEKDDDSDVITRRTVRTSEDTDVLIASTGEGETSVEGANASLVKGTHYEKAAAQLANKMRINLAWLILLVPVAAVIIVTKKLTSRLLLKK